LRLGTRVGYRIAPRFAPYAHAGAVLVTEAIDESERRQEVDFDGVKAEIGGGALF
jgi:hypothetical protein